MEQGKCAHATTEKIIEFDGFCIDATPAQFDWRIVQASNQVHEWQAPVLQPLLTIPLPLARLKSTKKTLVQESGAQSIQDELAPSQASHQKKPSGNACFNCGEPGHNVSSCPYPRDNDAINRRRKVSIDVNFRQKWAITRAE